MTCTTTRHPSAVAHRLPGAQASYETLNRDALQVARALSDLGIRPGDRVGQWLDPEPRWLASWLGVRRLGATLVLLEPELPAARARERLLETGAKALVSNQVRAAGALDGDLRHLPCLSVDGGNALVDWRELEAYPATPLRVPAPDATVPALVTYASGAAGAAGVCHGFAALEAGAGWLAEALLLGPADRLACRAPLGHPLVQAALGATLATGGSFTVPAPATAADPSAVVSWLARVHVTVLVATAPALLSLVEDGGLLGMAPEGLRALVVAGSVPTPLARRVHLALPAARLLLVQGAPELGPVAAHEVRGVPADDGPLPLGDPCAGGRLWIEEEEAGPLLASGPTVMLGHWGRPPRGDAPLRTGQWARRDRRGVLVPADVPEVAAGGLPARARQAGAEAP